MGQYNHKNNYLYSKNYKQMGLVYSVRAWILDIQLDFFLLSNYLYFLFIFYLW